MVFIKQFEVGPMQNFCYLIGDPSTKEALVVDPAWSVQKIISTVQQEGYKLTGLIISHAHFDHTNAIEEILKIYDVPVYANTQEIPYATSGASIVGKLGKTVKPMEGGETLKHGETELKFLHTPGHTPGSQCLLVGNHLITGDTLFIGGCGRSDLPGGDPAVLFKSLKKIAELPGHIQICPGHDYGVVPQRSLEEEKKENPYLQMTKEEEFVQAVG